MVQTLDVISVNLWQVLISLANLLIMFLILKRFLFKPVLNIIAQRRAQVDKVYSEADADRTAAAGLKAQYEEHLTTARDEADRIVRNATQSAQRRSDAMLSEAAEAAGHLKQKAEEEIRLERKQMIEGVRGEISDIAVSIAEKVVGREINKADHEGFVDEFIRNVGEQQ